MFVVDSKPDVGDFKDGKLKWDVLRMVGNHTCVDSVDLYKITHLKPYSIACLAALPLIAQHPISIKPPSDPECRSHLERLGFFGNYDIEQCDVDIRSTNVSIRCYDANETIDDFPFEAVDCWDKQFGGMTAGMKNEVAEHLWEIIMNALTHSESSIGCVVCGQAFPEKRKVDVAILDLGQTILGHLQKHPAHSSISTHHDAIVRATEEGVTGTVRLNKFNEPNSGNGLFCMREVCDRGFGEMSIISGDSITTFGVGGMIGSTHFLGGFNGCLVNIRFLC